METFEKKLLQAYFEGLTISLMNSLSKRTFKNLFKKLLRVKYLKHNEK